MSVVFRTLLPLLNRNLQLTLLVGAAILALQLVIPGGAVEVSGWSPADAAKAIVLAGLTTVLVILGNQNRSRAERIVARGTAMSACLLVAAHTLFARTEAWPITMALVSLVSIQVVVMRHFDS